MIADTEIENIATSCSLHCTSFVVYDNNTMTDTVLKLVDILKHMGCLARPFKDHSDSMLDVEGIIILSDTDDNMMCSVPNLNNSDKICFFYKQIFDNIPRVTEFHIWCPETQIFKYHENSTTINSYLAMCDHHTKRIMPFVYKEFVNTISMNEMVVIYAGPNYRSSFLMMSSYFIKDLINNAISNGIKHVIFANSEETLQSLFLKKAHRIMDLYDESIKFYYSTGCVSGADSYLNFCSENNIQPRLNMLCAYSFEVITKQKGIRHYLDIEYQTSIREKKFLCFNRVPRIQRLILLAELLNRDLVKDSFYSFSFEDVIKDSWEETKFKFQNILGDESQSSKSILTMIIQTIDSHIQKFPLVLDRSETNDNPVIINQAEKKWHDNSYFSVVNETIFFKSNTIFANLSLMSYIDGVFFSEKTYKPIYYKQPFILAGFPKSLSKLRNLGYKTFHPYINESYDDEPDDLLRLDMIVEEIQRLCKYTDAQWLEFMHNVKPIVDHNFNFIFENTNVDTTDYRTLFR